MGVFNRKKRRAAQATAPAAIPTPTGQPTSVTSAAPEAVPSLSGQPAPAPPPGPPARTPAPATDHDRLRTLEEENRGLKEQVTALQGLVARDGERASQQTRGLLLGLLDFVDAFERVRVSIQAKEDQPAPPVKVWLGNLRATLGLLRNLLSAHAVSLLEGADGEFDPRIHQPLEAVADPARPDGTIVRVEKPGYTWEGRLLRKALVVVVSNEAAGGRPVLASAPDAPPDVSAPGG